MKRVAVVDCTVAVTFDDPTVVGGVITLVSAPSLTSKCAQKSVLRGTTSYTLSGVTGAPDFVQPAPVTFYVEPTTTVTFADGEPVLREDDTGSVSIPLTSPTLGAKTATGTARVTSAGQQKVSSN